MSDEQQRPGDAARGGSGPDETREFDPFVDDENGPDGRPRSSDAWVLDNTEQMPRTSADDETVLAPRVDATAVMPAAEGGPGDDAGRGGVGPAWTGRAEVRPPRPGPGGDFPTGDWDALPPPNEPRGRWWMPIVVGMVVLVLLALLGWGVWLILQAGGDGDDTPAPGVTASASAPPATEPTSAPSTTTPTATASTTEPTGPTEVTVPALKGLSSASARQALSRRGLAYRLRFVTSADAPAGTVIDSDPAEGQEVPPDTTVTLILAAPPSSAATATTTSPATTAPTDTNDQQNDTDNRQNDVDDQPDGT
jgi:pyruvate/2-oxoglutarate dehydrogenase complex dihydrolipoamide acyltransferase (E2) component